MAPSTGPSGEPSNPRSGWRSSGTWWWKRTHGGGCRVVNPDFSDLFAALNAVGAKYLVIGAHAVAFHAEPRFTKDLDVWIEPNPGNAAQVFAALEAFGAPLGGVSEADFASPGITFQIGVAPNRIDIVTEIDGVGFAEAWPARAISRYGEQPIAIIGREELLRNKLAAGRPQDLLDIELLRRHER